MTAAQVTAWVLVVTVALWVVWDLYVYLFRGGAQGTISRVVLGFTREHPWFVFALGFVAGHLLWPQHLK